MSESATTHSKTASESGDSDSTDSPLIEDRWSHNITYRQLVLSSCIGIYQLCWNPYLHDLRRLVPFLFIYNIFSIVIAYPIFYLELALGIVTKKGVLNCWDLSPAARDKGFAMLGNCCVLTALAASAFGSSCLALLLHSLHAFLPWRRMNDRFTRVGFAMLGCCVFTALAASAFGSRCLALFVHSLHSFLPWLHCVAAAVPPCAARHRPISPDAETPAQSFYFNFVLNLKRDGLYGGLGNIVWELAVYYCICWVLIYCIVIKRVYSYSKLVLFKDVLAYFVLVCCGVGALRLDGLRAIFSEYDWNTLFEGSQIWREAIEYSLLEMSVGQGSLAMLGSYLPKQSHKLGTTALLALGASKTTCMGATMVLAANFAALKADYDDKATIPGGTSSAIIMWADYVARIPGSQFWSALVFFTLFVLSISTAALLVQTLMSTFTGRTLKKSSWAFLILICCLFCFIGVITLCAQGGQYILDFLMKWPVTLPRVLIAATLAGIVTYVYGQTTFCEDVYFSVGEYPSLFLRICWALTPAMLIIIFATGMGSCWLVDKSVAGCAVVSLVVMPIFLFMAINIIFKCRVRNIVRSEK